MWTSSNKKAGLDETGLSWDNFPLESIHHRLTQLDPTALGQGISIAIDDILIDVELGDTFTYPAVSDR